MNSLPPLKPAPQFGSGVAVVDGPHGVHDTLRGGLRRAGENLSASHPVEQIQSRHDKNQDEIRLTMLGSIQGSHMPMRIRMERTLVQKPVHHLPVIPCSNVAIETLTGKDETLDFVDFMNDPRQSERMGDPHMMMEYKLGML